MFCLLGLTADLPRPARKLADFVLTIPRFRQVWDLITRLTSPVVKSTAWRNLLKFIELRNHAAPC